MAGLPPPPRRTESVPPMSDAEPGREPARVLARAPQYFTPPEAHEKYEIPLDEQDPSKDYFWAPTRIAGQPNPKLSQYYRAGWQPEAASNFPRISGYGTEYPKSMIDRGLLHNVGADEPVVNDNDDLMLLSRAKEMSRAARKRDAEVAHRQVINQMERLNQAYRPADPRRPGVSRRIRPLEDAGYSEEA